MINPQLPTPMYIQIFENIQTQIREGKIINNEKLPSEKELGKMFNVSRITVRQALGMLEKKGLTFSVHGKGTFVRSLALNQNLMNIVSFSNNLQKNKLKGSTTLLNFKHCVKQEESYWPVELIDWNSAYQLELLGAVSEEPAVYYRSYIQNDIGKQLDSLVENYAAQHSVFSTFSLFEKINCQIEHIEQNIFAKESSKFLSEKLGIIEGKALLMMESLVYGKNDLLIEFKVAYYRTDKYYFSLSRGSELNKYPLNNRSE